jgi:hypothetical protein
MPTPTYAPLATVTLGSSASSVTFSSIPATYRDLILVFDWTSAAYAGIVATINGSTSDFSGVSMYGNGSTTSSSSGLGRQIASGQTNTTTISQFMDYSATDKHKTILTRHGYGTGEVGANASRWGSTAAITSFVVAASGTTFSSGSTFSLYGVIA